jgi:ketosteroid isomerase-like protein
MSQRNAETVRRLYETGAIDGRPDVLREVLAPEAVWVNPPEAVDPGTRHGAAEVVAAVENLTHSFDVVEHRLNEVFDAGDAVVAFVTFRARGRDSGAELTQDEAHTWTFRDGKVISFEWCRDLRGALEAVGLGE